MRWKVVGSVVGTVLAVIGVSGTPDDLANWGSVLDWLGEDGGRWVLLLAGLGLVVGINVAPLVQERREPHLRERITEHIREGNQLWRDLARREDDDPEADQMLGEWTGGVVQILTEEAPEYVNDFNVPERELRDLKPKPTPRVQRCRMLQRKLQRLSDIRKDMDRRQ